MSSQLALPRTRSARQGYALILVLSVIALSVIMVMAFLSRSTQERSAAAGNKATADARRLGDIAVSLVQGQINHATTRGSDVAWVSQPGMVRTFTSGGQLQNAYKLYSAPRMVNNSVSLMEDLAPEAWGESPAVWVDLNAPVYAGGVKNFPILPLSKAPSVQDPSPDASMEAGNGGGTILPVEGFGLDSTPPGATTYQPIPMPVRWLYVLEDGQLVAPPADATGKTVAIAGAGTANPIVGRIAFWTDDETAKININTAGEGTFWDAPRGYTTTEVYELANKQPANGEYQRYPGHPAMVSLSAVFPFSDPATDADPSRHVEDYLKLTPRYTFAGSKAGTVIISQIKADPTNSIKAKDDERLYSSLDEMLFTPSRNKNSFLTRPLLDSRRFFLTAHSRAPETNLFNLPRIAVWPIWEKLDGDWANRTTAYDKAIAFCSSTGPGEASALPYYFQRKDPKDPDYDLAGISRNGELYKYLQYLTARQIPGVSGGATFLSKYPLDRNNILTQIFDYVRCTNLSDGNLTDTTKHYTKYNASETAGASGSGMVAPIHGPGDTQGQGRFHTLRQLSILFTACADFDVPASNVEDNKMLCEPFPSGPFVPLQAGQRRIQMMLVPELFSTMVGWRTLVPELTIEIKGLDKFTLNGKNLQLPELGNTVFCRGVQAITGEDLGGSLIKASVYYMKTLNKRASLPYPAAAGEAAYGPGGKDLFPFISIPLTVPVASNTMAFTGGEITVNLYAGLTTSRKLIQSFKMTFPDGIFPVPLLSAERKHWSCFADGCGMFTVTTPDPKKPPVTTFYDGRSLVNNGENDRKFFSDGNDVIRAMVPRYSDYRYIATLREDDKIFVPHALYNSTTARSVWMREDKGGKMFTGQVTLLDQIPGSTELPSGITQYPADATGDFDVAPGIAPEGSFANKPDEGDLFQETANLMLAGPDGKTIPYYRRNRTGNTTSSYFSPNRIIPSQVMFGSLPTGARSNAPWRTLLFRPVSVPEESSHYGLASPRDHYLLDLFWMPVVAPYAISDRFSTAGKINMNYQIMPFTYVERSTALHAVLKAERLMQIPNTASIHPNLNSTGYPTVPTRNDRKVIDTKATLQQFRDRFSQPDTSRNVFLSASEICDIRLVPNGLSLAQAAAWKDYRQTGDNLREKPYATIYPKLTTKSNTYQVHFRAQSLKKAMGTPADTWTEGRDAVTSEYRGSTTIERYINPDAEIPNYAASALPSGDSMDQPTLDSFYKWRIIRNTQFAP